VLEALIKGIIHRNTPFPFSPYLTSVHLQEETYHSFVMPPHVIKYGPKDATSQPKEGSQPLLGCRKLSGTLASPSDKGGGLLCCPRHVSSSQRCQNHECR